ncbi:MAG: SAM-dependent methyltransferase [Rhodobacteraceae bacterium]|jgi:SAM-dependent methyltransferase|nr:SAM-dependent methyltransferase [Paracoccaceae bacterium]
MADTPPLLTDRARLDRQRRRAVAAGLADFLQRAARDDAEERLGMVNRRFTAPAVVTPFPHIWADLLPGTRVVPDDPVLALVPGAHDLVIHALALHWADDPVGQIVQCARALTPDGMFLGLTFGGQTLVELRQALAQAEADETGGLSPRVLPMGEIRDLGGLLQRAGLVLPVADSVTLTATYRDALALMRDLRAMGETNAMAARLRRPTRRAVIARAAMLHADAHALPDGRIPATFEIVALTGWAPGPGQPQPLRPGSAQMRLADALGLAGDAATGQGHVRTD